MQFKKTNIFLFQTLYANTDETSSSGQLETRYYLSKAKRSFQIQAPTTINFFSLPLSLTNKYKLPPILLPHICTRKQSAMPVKFRTKPVLPNLIAVMVYTFFPLTIQPGFRRGVSRPTRFHHVDIRFDGGHAVVLHRYRSLRGAIVALFRYTHYEALTGPMSTITSPVETVITLLLRPIPSLCRPPRHESAASTREENFQLLEKRKHPFHS